MNKNLLFPFSILVGLIGASLIISKPWVTIQHAEPIMVKGYAEQKVLADQGSLTVRISEQRPDNAEAYKASEESVRVVKGFLAEALGEEAEVLDLSTSISETKKLNEKGNRTNEIEYYVVSRSLRINTAKVLALAELSRKLYDLNAKASALL